MRLGNHHEAGQAAAFIGRDDKFTVSGWSTAQNTQRVYEYAVEPAVLQSLPASALLLPARGTAGPGLLAVNATPGSSPSPAPQRPWSRPASPAGLPAWTRGNPRKPRPRGGPAAAGTGRAAATDGTAPVRSAGRNQLSEACIP